VYSIGSKNIGQSNARAISERFTSGCTHWLNSAGKAA